MKCYYAFLVLLLLTPIISQESQKICKITLVLLETEKQQQNSVAREDGEVVFQTVAKNLSENCELLPSTEYQQLIDSSYKDCKMEATKLSAILKKIKPPTRLVLFLEYDVQSTKDSNVAGMWHAAKIRGYLMDRDDLKFCISLEGDSPKSMILEPERKAHNFVIQLAARDIAKKVLEKVTAEKDKFFEEDKIPEVQYKIKKDDILQLLIKIFRNVFSFILY